MTGGGLTLTMGEILTVGSNTSTQVEVETSAASDADEARWNYAFWLQSELGALAVPR